MQRLYRVARVQITRKYFKTLGTLYTLSRVYYASNLYVRLSFLLFSHWLIDGSLNLIDVSPYIRHTNQDKIEFRVIF